MVKVMDDAREEEVGCGGGGGGGGQRLDTDWQLLSRLHPQFTTDIRLLPPQKFSSDFVVQMIYIK